MDRIAKQYANNAKSFFPIYTSREKEYIRKLELNMEDYCEDNNIVSLEELYQKCGTPSDVAHTYFSTCDSEYILKKLRLAKIIKISVISLVIVAFMALSFYCATLYSEYKVFAEQQIYFEEDAIE